MIKALANLENNHMNLEMDGRMETIMMELAHIAGQAIVNVSHDSVMQDNNNVLDGKQFLQVVGAFNGYFQELLSQSLAEKTKNAMEKELSLEEMLDSVMTRLDDMSEEDE